MNKHLNNFDETNNVRHLLHLSKECRGNSNYKLSYMFASHALTIIRQRHNIHPIGLSGNIYKCNTFDSTKWKVDNNDHTLYLELLYEQSISGYYSNFKNTGFLACEELMLSFKQLNRDRTSCRFNVKFYCKPIPSEYIKSIIFSCDRINMHSPDLYKPLNPSIVKTKDGFTCNLRTVNYLHNKGIYTYGTGESKVNTRNYILDMDKELNILSSREIIEDIPSSILPRYDSVVIGLEDIRLIQTDTNDTNDGIWFTCTTVDTSSNSEMTTIETSLGKLCKTSVTVDRNTIASKSTKPYTQVVNELDDNKLTSLITQDSNMNSRQNIEPLIRSIYKVESLIPLKVPVLKRCEKNWLPFMDNGKLRVLYSANPTISYTPDKNTGVCTEYTYNKPTSNISQLRGGSSLIKYNLNNSILNPSGEVGFLYIPHEVLMSPSTGPSRIYLHRFVWLTKDLRIKCMSKPFYFKQLGVEFCIGLCMDHDPNFTIVTFGVEDREAYYTKISTDTINSICNIEV